jgi:glycosyltransferase involved in cell wall biosynthesis
VTKLKKYNIIGTIFGTTGYDIHTRKLANALNKVADVRLDTPRPDQWQRYVNDAELAMINKKFDSSATTIMITQPHFWRIGISEKPKQFWGFCVWEGDKVPDYWHEYLNDKRVNKILVPSNHTKQAILNTFKVSVPIEILSHGYDDKVFHPTIDLKALHKPLTFIYNKGWAKGRYDRGGVQFLLEAYSKEFKAKEAVQLKIHINPSYNAPDWDLKKELDKLNLNRKGKSKVYITTDVINESTLNQFYNEGDIFVSPSMAEAFNLPVLEAMGCGLVPVVSHFGGQSDYVDDDNGFILKKGKIAKFSDELAYEDVKWFKPDIKELRKVLRYCYNNQDVIMKKKYYAWKTAKTLTWDKNVKKMA